MQGQCISPNETTQIIKELNHLFDRKYSFQPCENWCLPPLTAYNQEKTWNIIEFQKLKCELNSVKSLLNDKGEKWHNHTAEINKAGLVIRSVKSLVKPEFITQAWCKFYEILKSFPLIAQHDDLFRTFHICEAPGAFISALNYHLCSSHEDIILHGWEWYANTLNPYYEGHSIKNAVVDDRLLFHTLDNWHFGVDNTGDVLLPNYHSDVKSFLTNKDIHLVTADGSFSCLDNPGEQELLVKNLQLAEVMIAFDILSDGGNFVIKKFTFFECISICTMYLLNCCFEQVHVFKPVTSKSGNSEVYVVCLSFKGRAVCEPIIASMKQQLNCDDVALIARPDIPENFIHQLQECINYFMNFQITSIKENLDLYNNMTQDKWMYFSELKEMCVNLFIAKYSLQPYDSGYYCYLFPRDKRRVKTAFGGTYTNLKVLNLKAVGNTFNKIQDISTMKWSEYLLDLESRLNSCFPLEKKRKMKSMEWIPTWTEIRKYMKMQKFEKHLVTGKPFSIVQNSKFCHPHLLLLWNEVIKNQQVLPENHQTHDSCYWDDCDETLHSSENMLQTEVVFAIQTKDHDNDSVALWFQKTLRNDAKIYHCKLVNIAEQKHCNLKKVFVVDSSKWFCDTFNSETQMRLKFVDVISTVIKNLDLHSSLILCLPICLTRFMAGILFLLLSHFAQVTTIPPSDTSPALSCLIWVLDDFQSPNWTESFIDYLRNHILNFKENETTSIVETVPIPALCGGQFYEYILDINFSCMLRTLRSLINVEKLRLKCES